MRQSVEKVRPGDRLIKTLNDPKESLTKRLDAARSLGRMQYVPAIPHLLKHLALTDLDALFREVVSLEELESRVKFFPREGPCGEALLCFGHDMTIPAIRMYVASATTEPERRLLATLLRSQDRKRTRAETREHVRTFGRDLKTQAERDRLIELYRLLHDRKDEFYVPDNWPRFAPGGPDAGGPSRPLDHVADRLKSSG
jgi:hypothetical protein